MSTATITDTITALDQAYVDLTEALIAPSCGTRSWDMQSSWHACQDAAYRMGLLGDNRLELILDRATSSYATSGRDDAVMTLMTHDALMRSVADDICQLMQIAEIRPSV